MCVARPAPGGSALAAIERPTASEEEEEGEEEEEEEEEAEAEAGLGFGSPGATMRRVQALMDG